MGRTMFETSYVREMENSVISKIKKAKAKAKELLKEETGTIDLNQVFDDDEIIDIFIKDILLSKTKT